MFSFSQTGCPVDEPAPFQRDGAGASAADFENGADNPSVRILRTIECLASGGPMTLDELAGRLGVSKSAVWRVVGHLRDANWVQLKQGNRLIELHHRVDEMLSCATFSDEEFAGIGDKLDDLSAELSVHIDLFALTHNDAIDLIDTTRRWRGDRAALMESLDDDVLLVMKSVMSDSALARHMAAWGADGTAEKPLRMRRSKGTLRTVQWSQDTQSLNIAVRGLKGTPGALRVSGRRRKLKRQECRDIIASLRTLLNGSINFVEHSANNA